MTELSELFSIREDLREKAFSAKTPEERMHYALLKHAIESDILDMANNSEYPRDNVLAERYDVSEFFIQFPIALPTELKGIAV